MHEIDYNMKTNKIIASVLLVAYVPFCAIIYPRIARGANTPAISNPEIALSNVCCLTIHYSHEDIKTHNLRFICYSEMVTNKGERVQVINAGGYVIYGGEINRAAQQPQYAPTTNYYDHTIHSNFIVKVIHDSKEFPVTIISTLVSSTTHIEVVEPVVPLMRTNVTIVTNSVVTVEKSWAQRLTNEVSGNYDIRIR